MISKKIALVSPVLIPKDKKKNIQAVEAALKKYKNRNVDLIVFPEANIIGGFWKDGKKDFIDLAEEIPKGDSSRKIIRLTKKYKIPVCVGMTEKSKGKHYITHFLSGAKGFIGKQRKVFAYNPKKEPLFYSGKSIIPINLLGLKISILACADFFFPEPSIMAGLKDTNVILSPTDCFPTKDKVTIEVIRTLLRARALDTGSFALATFGSSKKKDNKEVLAYLAVNPEGEIITYKTKTENTKKEKIIEIEIKKIEGKWGGLKKRAEYLKR
jgi:predicted amidohydrolase